jgi:predicted GNAT family N-acyltransferase
MNKAQTVPYGWAFVFKDVALRATFAFVKDLQFCFINIDTPAYEEMVQLRMHVLLEPIGIPHSYIDPVKETNDLLIGAYEDGRLIGGCILTKISDTTVQLRQMAVASSLQKKGIGTAILHFAENTARERGYHILMMHARDTVLPFYEKCGYQVAGEQFFEVGIAHHKMQKALVRNEGLLL